MTPKLLYRPGACALAPHIVLHWTELEHEAKRAERDDPELRAVSPAGAVPAFLVGDGRALTQAAAIMQHIARRADRLDLLGHDTPEHRDEVCMWLSFFTGDFHPAFWPYFGPMAYLDMATEEEYPRIKAAGVALVKRGLAKIDEHLAGREYFVGSTRTVVDAYAVPMLRWCKNIRDIGLDGYAETSRFYASITRDDGVVAAMSVQGISP